MRPIRVLIVDDEPIARHVLREQLESFPDVEITGEAENGRDAYEKIAEIHPDLVFLDLEMPTMGGFEVIRKLGPNAPPAVVIVTAYQEHSFRAFETGAIDYLLKPVSTQRLRKALDRVRALLPGDGGRDRRRRVVARHGNEFVLLELDDILAFQAEGELVWIITTTQRFLAMESLRGIEARVNDQKFQRVHRNAIVNINHVRKLSPLNNSRWLITLHNEMQVVTSKRQARNVRKILRW